MNSTILLDIVRTWDLNPKPEYRGFRCANCQNYMHKAWHHWLTSGGYTTPVHFCNRCERLYQAKRLEVTKSRKEVKDSQFVHNLSSEAESKIAALVKKWHLSSTPLYKTFTCDNCGDSVHKAYHVWTTLRSKLVESHFCRPCGDPMFS